MDLCIVDLINTQTLEISVGFCHALVTLVSIDIDLDQLTCNWIYMFVLLYWVSIFIRPFEIRDVLNVITSYVQAGGRMQDGFCSVYKKKNI